MRAGRKYQDVSGVGRCVCGKHITSERQKEVILRSKDLVRRRQNTEIRCSSHMTTGHLCSIHNLLTHLRSEMKVELGLSPIGDRPGVPSPTPLNIGHRPLTTTPVSVDRRPFRTQTLFSSALTV